MAHQSVINGSRRLSTSSIITDKTWDCISHIQGISLYGGSCRVTPLQKQYEKRGWQKGVDISFGRKGVNITFDEGCEFKEKGCDNINSLNILIIGRWWLVNGRHATDGLHWLLETELTQLDAGSDGERLSWGRISGDTEWSFTHTLATTDTSLRAAAHQLPFQVWKYDYGLSESQVWMPYHITTKQLNVYHAGCPTDNSCVHYRRVTGYPETSIHVFWECPKARACKGKFLGHWTGTLATPRIFSRCVGNCVNSQAPEIPALQWSRLLERF
uniref:RxLR effector candidate protein n=1 Tax=Hyaloperonospora arabidopsidis (strain Emoy2) TaxID=559515 RepID=M4BGN9_HYAAE